MPTSSITKNFIVSGKEQIETFANAIEESYQESLTTPKIEISVKYVTDPKELLEIAERITSSHRRMTSFTPPFKA